MNTITDAINFAKEYHLGQMYGDVPYTEHLQEVADMLENMGHHGQEVLQVAWLHDVIEDTSATYETLKDYGFSDPVIWGVKHITKEKGEDYWDYIKKVKSHVYSLPVKKADTLCNLTHSVMENNVSRIKKYSNQIKILYEGDGVNQSEG